MFYYNLERKKSMFLLFLLSVAFNIHGSEYNEILDTNQSAIKNQQEIVEAHKEEIFDAVVTHELAITGEPAAEYDQEMLEESKEALEEIFGNGPDIEYQAAQEMLDTQITKHLGILKDFENKIPIDVSHLCPFGDVSSLSLEERELLIKKLEILKEELYTYPGVILLNPDYYGYWLVWSKKVGIIVI